MEISIIIPIYNSEKYLDYCLNSIERQTFKDYEVIMINDGSTDRSKIVCERYSAKDSKFIFIDKKNEGVSLTRNLGIKNAHGKYLMFIDADDWISKNALEIMHKEIVEKDADMVCGSIQQIWPHININEKLEYSINDINDKNNCDDLLDIGANACAKLIKKETIDKNNIHFSNYKSREDALFYYDLLKCCKKVISLDNIIYYYNKLECVTSSSKVQEDFNKCCFEICESAKTVYSKWFNNHECFDGVVSDMYCHYFLEALTSYLNSRLDRLALLKETYEIFRNKINLDKIDKYSKQILGFDIGLFLKNDDFYQIINLYDNNSKKTGSLETIKKVIKNMGYAIKTKKYAYSSYYEKL